DFRPPVTGPFEQGRVRPSGRWPELLLECRETGDLLTIGRLTTMKIRPLHDRVVVRRSEEETKTAGGIVLPGSAAEKPNTGVVVAVGAARLLDNGEVRSLAVKEGDKLVFCPYSGSSTIKIDGEELLNMSESENYGVLEG